MRRMQPCRLFFSFLFSLGSWQAGSPHVALSWCTSTPVGGEGGGVCCQCAAAPLSSLACGSGARAALQRAPWCLWHGRPALQGICLPGHAGSSNRAAPRHLCGPFASFPLQRLRPTFQPRRSSAPSALPSTSLTRSLGRLSARVRLAFRRHSHTPRSPCSGLSAVGALVQRWARSPGSRLALFGKHPVPRAHCHPVALASAPVVVVRKARSFWLVLLPLPLLDASAKGV